MSALADTRSAYDDLASVYAPVAAVVFALVLLTLALVALRFRSGRAGPPSARRDAPRLELTYAVLLAVIAGLLLWRSYDAIGGDQPLASASASPRGPAAVTIGVVASQWNWRFTYPGGVVADGRRAASGLPTLVVPAGQPVRLRLTLARRRPRVLDPGAARSSTTRCPGYTNAFDLRFEPGPRLLDRPLLGVLRRIPRPDALARRRAAAPRAFARWLRTRRQRRAA